MLVIRTSLGIRIVFGSQDSSSGSTVVGIGTAEAKIGSSPGSLRYWLVMGTMYLSNPVAKEGVK